MTLKVHTETGMRGEIREYYLFTSALEARQALGTHFINSHKAWHVSCCEYRVYK